ncbi:hypothetical protein Tco_1237414 [Tanacetum coccineum]
MIEEESFEGEKEVAATEEVLVNPLFPDQRVTIGGGLSEACRDQIKCILKDNMGVFAWEPSDITGVPRRIIEHMLNVNPSLDPFRRRPTAKGVGLPVADSRTVNHSKDDFTPLETIQRLYSVFGRRSYLGFEGETFEPKGRLDERATYSVRPRFNIPQDVKIILPKRSQTIFDAPLGYVGLYTHHFSLSNLRLPIPSFICEVLNYFKVHISRFNPFSIVKLTTFAIMCKAYGGEPTVNLLRSFLNLGHAGDWLTLSKRGNADVFIALVKPITHLANWNGSFFYVENKITPLDYPEFLLESNKFNKKYFRDKVPLHPKLDPLYDQIATYPCRVRTFPDPILYLAEMDFKSFMMQEIDGEFKFPPEGYINDNQGSHSSKSVNNEALTIDAKPLTSVHPSDFVEDVVDSDDASARDNENPLVGTSLSPLLKAGEKLRSLIKRKLPSRVGDSLPKVRKMAPQASKVAGEASDPLDVDSDTDIHELKDSADCHWVVAHVTPPSWKEHLCQISLKQLCDIHDRAYMRQVVLDNVLNSRTQELISALHKATASYDAIQARELKKDKAYDKLERRCNEALLDLDKNPLVADMRTEIEALQGREMDALKQDRASVVAKVVSDAATKLIRSDEMGMLVAKLVKASIIYGRCAAFEEVANLKEPFVMEKLAGYRPTSKQEYDQAGDDLANASYPFLSKYVNDPYASLEQLFLKKPESLHSKPSYVKAK